MLQTNDLNFAAEIFPLFDHTRNDCSKDTLIQILSDRPDSVQEIYTRQSILKALIGHGRFAGSLSYSRSEFNEVYAYTKDLRLRDAGLRSPSMTYLSISKGIIKNHFTFPSFIDNGLSIKGFYHPSLKQPVLNDMDSRKNVVLITGPNMSGKSTLLRSIGLCVYLAHLGLAVPAEKCELRFFDIISVAININDDIRSGYSHFMTEIKTLKNVLLEARRSKSCFAIFDELFRGTNAEDALVISRRTIGGLTQFHDCCFFISTHLRQLKPDIADNENIAAHFIDCRLVGGLPVFTYQVRPGWSDLKIGQIIFDQEGLNELLK